MKVQKKSTVKNFKKSPLNTSASKRETDCMIIMNGFAATEFLSSSDKICFIRSNQANTLNLIREVKL